MDSKTWWIIIAIIVVILILVLIAAWQGKRRTAARRDEAQHLRGRAKENEATVSESRQRAESATEQAERARAEAAAKQREADELAAEAQHEQKTAEAVERDHAETLRKADRLDPDTPTDRHGNRVEGTGSRGDGEGESRIDPNTGQPVEEAARERDVRADRPRHESPEVHESPEEDARDRHHVVRPDGSVGDERPEGEAGSHAAPGRASTDGELPVAEDAADESDGLKPPDTVNRLFGRHARDNGPDDGVEPPKR